jgi:hypothetical protein
VNRYLHMPLWLKLTLAGLLVEALMLGLLVISNLNLTEQELIKKTQLRVESAIPLLNAALGTPLMHRDYGALIEILEEAALGRMPMSIWRCSTLMDDALPAPAWKTTNRCPIWTGPSARKMTGYSIPKPRSVSPGSNMAVCVWASAPNF